MKNILDYFMKKEDMDKNEEKLYKDFLEYFDGKVPNPQQYPIQYEFYIKTYLNSKNKEK